MSLYIASTIQNPSKKYVCYVEEVAEEKFDEKVIKEESNTAMIFKSEEDEKNAMEKLRGYIGFWK